MISIGPMVAGAWGAVAAWRSAGWLVPPRGFEPLISTLKGWRPRPLDDGGMGRPESTRGSRRGPRPGAGLRPGRDSRNKMTAPARQPTPIIAAMPPPTPSAERPPVPAVDARPPRRPQRVGGEGEEDDPEDHAAGRQQRDLRRVADRDGVERRRGPSRSARRPGRRARARSAAAPRRGHAAASEGPVVDRHVVGQARPLHRRATVAPDVTEGRRQERRPPRRATRTSRSNGRRGP